MMKTRFVASGATLAIGLLAATAAHAQTALRAWVSGHGTDTAGCGSPVAPCRSLQFAHDSIVAAGGEIDVLDPAGYGAITITKSISIINDGVGTAGVQASSGTAITINAPSANVTLRGLDIEGVGAAEGVEFLSGSSLRVLDSTIKGFTGANLLFKPPASATLYVSDTRSFDGGVGLSVFPQVMSGTATVQATLVRVELDHNADGLILNAQASGQGLSLSGLLSDSVVADSADACAETATNGAPSFLMVRDSTFAHCAIAIGALSSGAVVDLAHSTLSGNTTVFAAPGGGMIASFGDNDIDGNGSPGVTPTSIAPR